MPGESVETLPYEPQGDYAPFYNHELYCQILPLCQHAFQEEQNGRAEEHAFKLSLLFKDVAKVVNYLKEFNQEGALTYPVHDACLFDLPAADSDFYSWKSLSHKKGVQGRINLLNPRFRDLLPHTEAIGKLIRTERETSPLNDDEIKKKQSELDRVKRKYRKISQKPQLHPTAAQKERRKKELSNLRQQQSLLSIELATIARGIELPKANVGLLSAFYEQYLQQASPAQGILIKQGISERDIALFYSLVRKDSEAIPKLIIDGTSLGYPGYYLTKLDTLSDQGAAIAACLGKMTKCCQHLGGQGAACSLHGICSELGGFYVLWKGNADNPSLDDEVIAQSWAWRAKTAALCLDSIEAKTEAKEIAVDMYRALAITLCSGAYPLTQVNTGTQSGISREVALRDYPTIKIESPDYYGYSDSKSQFYLADQSLPYLFFNKCKSEALNALIRTNSEQFFTALFRQEGLLKDNEDLKKAIAFALYFQKENGAALLELLMEKAGTAHKDELERLIQVNRGWMAALDEGRIDFALLGEGAHINAMSEKYGQSALHLAVLKPDIALVEQLIAAGAYLDIQDKSANTPLNNALEEVLYERRNESGRELARFLISNSASLDIKDKNDNAPLILAVNNNDPEMVRTLVEAGADIEILDDNLKTPLYCAAQKGYEAIFNYLYEKNADVNVVSLSDEVSLLMIAAWYGNAAMVGKILARTNVNFRHKNVEGKTALFDVNNPESLRLILNCYPEQERIAAINMTRNSGASPLHSAAERGLLEVVQSLIEQGAEVNQLSKWGYHAMYRAAKEGEFEIVKYLVASGADVAKLSEGAGCTPLQIAVLNRQWEVARLLFERGYVHKKDIDGVLSYALRAQIPEDIYEKYWGLFSRLESAEKIRLLIADPKNLLKLLERQKPRVLRDFLDLSHALDIKGQPAILTLFSQLGADENQVNSSAVQSPYTFWSGAASLTLSSDEATKCFNP
ncbi:Phosphocholine transferase AnkX [Legionella massiliensis]|uniref:Phosphocholine transferase AnkX n=1 Tax=Legionella massiliensis TaxID=1034943 RepID=A0A078KX18_9GAMM|nr:ankyrin repeat domain-containing protein [Legionella massiliensis]CDZ77501.1 Phosphocholine transferase AnkX [Legionella massiliensis]CEE13239.1 Phosphocholine transferase AnkX [Legionella massiliensis]